MWCGVLEKQKYEGELVYKHREIERDEGKGWLIIYLFIYFIFYPCMPLLRST